MISAALDFTVCNFYVSFQPGLPDQPPVSGRHWSKLKINSDETCCTGLRWSNIAFVFNHASAVALEIAPSSFGRSVHHFLTQQPLNGFPWHTVKAFEISCHVFGTDHPQTMYCKNSALLTFKRNYWHSHQSQLHIVCSARVGILSKDDSHTEQLAWPCLVLPWTYHELTLVTWISRQRGKQVGNYRFEKEPHKGCYSIILSLQRIDSRIDFQLIFSVL